MSKKNTPLLPTGTGERYSQTSVVDPYLFVFGPPRSVIQMDGSGSFNHQAKIVKKTLIPTVKYV
jgi:hypothetical protein